MATRDRQKRCARAVQRSLDNVAYMTCLNFVRENWRRFDGPISEKKQFFVELAKKELEPELVDDEEMETWDKH